MTLNQILRSLEDRNLSVVSARTGLSPGTIYAIAKGNGPTPRRATLITLARYLSNGAETYTDDVAQ